MYFDNFYYEARIKTQSKPNVGPLSYKFKKTPEECKKAVALNGLLIDKVPKKLRTEEICLIALSQTHKAMFYVPNELKNTNFLNKAISLNGMCLESIPKKEQTYEQVLTAVTNNPLSLKFAAKKHIDMEICKLAVSKNGITLEYIPEKFYSNELIELAINSNGLALQFIDNPNEKLCTLAFNQTPYSLRFFPDEYKNYDICLYAVKCDGILIDCVPQYIIDDTLLNAAIQKTWEAYICLPTEKFTLDNTMNFFELLKQNNYISFSNKYINQIISNIPLSIIKNEQILENIKQLKLLQKKFRYNAETDIVIITETLFDKEITQRTIESFEIYFEQNPNDAIKLLEETDGISREMITNYREKFYSQSNHLSSNLRKSTTKRRMLNNNNDFVATHHNDKLYIDNSAIHKIEAAISKTDINSLVIQNTENNTELANITPHDLISPLNNDLNQRFYYVSDIHLIQYIKKNFNIQSYDSIYNCIKDYVRRLIKDTYNQGKEYPPILLIGGDVSSDLEITKLFYKELAEQWGYWNRERIIAILGNHELWGVGNNIDETINEYRLMFKELGITFLHNEALFVNRELSNGFIPHLKNQKTYFKLSYEEILKLDSYNDSEFHEKFDKTSYVILGGMGFAGLNPVYNTSIGLYKDANISIECEKKESKKLSLAYASILKYFANKQVIVFSHMAKTDWTSLPYHPGWIYVSGHTHHNGWKHENNYRLYFDNQLGYNYIDFSLKHFYLKSIDYDIFEYYDDGCYRISKAKYKDFNYGKGLSGDGNIKNRKGKILMLKSSGIYCFFFKDNNNGKLYFLNGNVLNNIECQDINYYFDNLSVYANSLKEIAFKRQQYLEKISETIKLIGGNGKIHGSIVDIDEYSHIYLDLSNGNITPYFARSITEKYIYDDVRTLLKNHASQLYNNYVKLLEGEQYKDIENLTVQESNDPVLYPDTNIYTPSLKMKKIQSLLNKNVIRIWDESVFDIFKNNKQPNCTKLID